MPRAKTTNHPRREQFCQYVAAGIKPLAAYKLAGYSAKGAHCRYSSLLQDASISSRIEQLKLAIAQKKVEPFEEIAYQTWLSENFVMTGFRMVFEAALAEKKYSDANTALTQMGKKLGMFVERTKGEFKWNGDFGSLAAEQLAMAKASLMRDAVAAGLAPGGRLTLPSGDVIEVTAADVPARGPVQVVLEV